MKQNTTYKQTELGLIPEDWEVKKLGDIGDVKMCKRIFANQTSEIGDVPFYKIGTFGKEPDAYINQELYKEYRNKYSFPKMGEILLSASGTVGRTVIYNGEDAYFQDSNIVWIENDENLTTNDYLYYTYQIVKYQSEGGTIQRLYNSIIKSAKFRCPPLPEQKKIADCLSTWDVAIEKQNALINALTDRKKALMQQLLTGKKRLPGFSGEWKEVKLGSICENFQNGNAFSAKDYKKTGIPIVTMGNINLGGYFYFSESKSNFWIEDKSLERYEIKKGDLIIAMTDVTPEKNLIGLTSIIDIDRIFYLNQRVGHIILKPKLADTDFIFYLSQNSYWRNQCKAFATLGVQANLGTNDIKNINIKLPSLSEQTAIAEILATADRELQLQKEKLFQLQTQKKGLMQVLLTGKKRLLN